jgi:methyltransferase
LWYRIDARLTPGIRCTVKIETAAYGKTGQIKGKVMSPTAPREDNGTYWGFATRLASSIKEVFEDCPYEGGYDLKIGTSERGSQSIEAKGYCVPKFTHSLIVFGGIAGIEECVDADESIRLPGSESRKLFDQWVNVCPYQGSRTIRTEEAVFIALAKFSPILAAAGDDASHKGEPTSQLKVPRVDFTDEPSDESSESEDSRQHIP